MSTCCTSINFYGSTAAAAEVVSQSMVTKAKGQPVNAMADHGITFGLVNQRAKTCLVSLLPFDKHMSQEIEMET